VSRVTKVVGVKLNPSAECNSPDCMWGSLESAWTRNDAKEHVKATGHPVVVRTVISDLYRLEGR
jgi:S-formylglutathione hydrolase FrmB